MCDDARGARGREGMELLGAQSVTYLMDSYTYIFISESRVGVSRGNALLQLIRMTIQKESNACATRSISPLSFNWSGPGAPIKFANTVVPRALLLVIFCAPAMYTYILSTIAMYPWVRLKKDLPHILAFDVDLYVLVPRAKHIDYCMSQLNLLRSFLGYKLCGELFATQELIDLTINFNWNSNTVKST